MTQATRSNKVTHDVPKHGLCDGMKKTRRFAMDANYVEDLCPEIEDESFDLEKDSESESSPSGGYRFTYWQMGVKE